MSALWDSLIPAGAGLLGAVIGVIGSLLASRRASRTALEQVRYAVQYERKAQVMATAYDKVAYTRDKLDLLARLQTTTDEVAERSVSEYLESEADAEAYLNRYAVWNDPEEDQQLRFVQQQCRLIWGQFQRVVRSGPSSTEFERAKNDLHESINGGAIAGGMKVAGSLMQRKLTLDKPQRGQ